METITYKGHTININKNGHKYSFTIAGKIVKTEKSDEFDGLNFMICVAKSRIDEALDNYHIICL